MAAFRKTEVSTGVHGNKSFEIDWSVSEIFIQFKTISSEGYLHKCLYYHRVQFRDGLYQSINLKLDPR